MWLNEARILNLWSGRPWQSVWLPGVRDLCLQTGTFCWWCSTMSSDPMGSCSSAELCHNTQPVSTWNWWTRFAILTRRKPQTCAQNHTRKQGIAVFILKPVNKKVTVRRNSCQFTVTRFGIFQKVSYSMGRSNVTERYLYAIPPEFVSIGLRCTRTPSSQYILLFLLSSFSAEV